MQLFSNRFAQKKHNFKILGLSMIEVLMVVAILLIIFLLLSRNLFPQLAKGKDARRKGDLDKIKIAMEEYYNDNGCYPPQCALSTCTDELDGYLRSGVPKDPGTKTAYVYVVHPGGEECRNHRSRGFQIFSILDNTADPAITSLGCDGEDGCDIPAHLVAGTPIAREAYVYGVSEGVPVAIYKPRVDYSTACSEPSADTSIFCKDDNNICNNVTGSLASDNRCLFPEANLPNGCWTYDSNCGG